VLDGFGTQLASKLVNQQSHCRRINYTIKLGNNTLPTSVTAGQAGGGELVKV